MPIEVYDEESKVYYKSIIEGVDDDSLAIGVPMREKNQLLLRENNTYAFRLTVGDALYSFDSMVIGRRRSGNVSLIVVEWPDELTRIQRRQFFRMTVAMDGHYWMLEEGSGGTDADPDEPPVDDADTVEPETPPLNLRQPLHKLVDSLGDPEKAVVLDISGGGVAMSVNRCVTEDSLLAIRIYLQSKQKKKVVLLKGRVVRSFAMDTVKGLTRYRMGIEFVEISEKIRDDLINFIFIMSREKTR